MTIEPLALLVWLAWGTLVGIDLVTVPQGLLSRPIVAASVTGLLFGDPGVGLVVGMTLELYALDVLPIGASRYPDYGIAAVAAAAAAAHSAPAMAPAIAGLVGLPMAIIGGWSLHRLRRRNAVSVQRRLERVAAGDARAIWELQRNGLIRDAMRSLGVTTIGVVVALVITRIPWSELRHVELLSWAAVAGGLVAVLSGALRSSGDGARRRWLAVGLGLGIVVVLIR
jgi:mannose/fructose/N-acetylgalactosamine-specific phosphotransferase system component IIC